MKSSLVRILHRIHFYAGVLVAPFLLIAAVTGALYALAPSVENVVYRHELHTDSVGVTQSLADQIGAAQKTRPDLQVSAVRPPAESGDTTQVLFADPTLGDSERLAVFVDPVTLETRGELPVYGSSNALPMRQWLDRLHRDLHLGEPGRLYSELAASWLWVIVLAGLGIWFARTRKARRRVGAGRTRTVHRHAVIGMWISVGLVFLSATGLTWSTYAGQNVSDLRTALSWTTPATDTSLSGSTSAPSGGEHAGHGSPVASGDTSGAVAQVDAAVALARSVGIDSGIEVTLPAEADTAYTVAEVRRPWQFSPDTVAVDPASDRVVSENRFADWPLAARASNLAIALHMGLLFGVANQIVLFLLAAALVAMIVLGYRAWWQRRNRRAPAAGGLRAAPWPVSVGLIAIAIAVGWFVPLLGWPLLVFVVVDVVSTFVRSRRRPGDDGQSAADVSSVVEGGEHVDAGVPPHALVRD
ncbi:PepSY domain-containing protein [Gordonia sp. PDNC005]|uniref:PepSY-associated TM helix domain-containing protein n=1 Tax=unclassified Gordonia (in: high G+C Gram-positive bacteria) TaxID=2657482 RepID=UPI0019656FBB|nr:PepSY domain-containing protein [Gordonia sp. PDNC005]QRY63348.1 PepSY domain-containing protein [Gordonia sp. PDNC005]